MNAITRAEAALIQGPTIAFELDGREVAARAGETLLQVADREGVAIPRLCYKEGFDLAGNCRACMVEIDGERVLAPSCCRAPAAGMKVSTQSERVVKSQKLVLELLLSDVGEPTYTRHSELDTWALAARRRHAALSGAPAGGGRPVAPGDDGPPRRLHPVHALRSRLPRRAGQRRHRPGLPRPRREDRLRHGRSDGRVDVRRLRRMRAGVPDRRADAGARRRARGGRQAGRVAVPVLRRRLPAHLQRQGQPHPLRRGPRRPGQPLAPVREGPLRLRLRAPSASADDAAHPPRRRAAEARRLHDGSRARDGRLPRGDLGRGARFRRRHAAQDPRSRRPGVARRVRLGEGQQRGGLPVPEARPHRLSQQQRRPLHAALPRVVGGGAARRHRLGRGLESGDGRDEGRGRHPHRRQSDGEPSGRRDLAQERGQERHQADRLRPAPLRPRPPRAPLPAVQGRHRRRVAELDDARHRRRRPGRRRLHRQPDDRLRRAARERRGVLARADGADLRHRRRRRSARSRASTRRRRRR